MGFVTPAFATPATSTLLAAPSKSCICGLSRPQAVVRRAVAPRMTAAGPGSEPPAEEDEETATRSATEILRTLREDASNDPNPNEGKNMLGVYRDVDGRSNVMAVEPPEETDTGPQLSKTTIIIAAAAFIVIALLVLPLLPFTNPDQA